MAKFFLNKPRLLIWVLGGLRQENLQRSLAGFVCVGVCRWEVASFKVLLVKKEQREVIPYQLQIEVLRKNFGRERANPKPYINNTYSQPQYTSQLNYTDLDIFIKKIKY